MTKDGTGGANTNKNGLSNEKKQDLSLAVSNNNIDYDWWEKGLKIHQMTKDITITQKHKFLDYILHKWDINWNTYLSKKLLADNVLIDHNLKKIYIIEIKYQEGAGSVDEKLQTVDFKSKQYKKLLKDSGYLVNYYYILNDWFKKGGYKDSLEYIESVGSKYFWDVNDFIDYLYKDK